MKMQSRGVSDHTLSATNPAGREGMQTHILQVGRASGVLHS